MPTDRLPHGYSNETRLKQEFVEKRYLGPDAESGAHTEAAALAALENQLPVPRIASFDGVASVLKMVHLEGENGQALLASGLSDRVMLQCGCFLRRIARIDATQLGFLSGDGSVLVHGDYGPHNLLLTPDAETVLGIVDWEFARLGTAVEDVAWAEWIVRIHHRDCLESVQLLFEGFGERPPWQERRRQMLLNCERGLRRAEARGNDSVISSWRERIDQTRGFADL